MWRCWSLGRRALTTRSGASARRRGDCIILAGPPGSGKTTVGRILSARLRRPFIDVDDDVLEPTWSKSVAEMLSQMGDTGFLAAEATATASFEFPHRSIISLTGSNPLSATTMEYLATCGQIVLLDASIDAISARLHEMKTDRIVGQAHGNTLDMILRQRITAYDRCYDHRITLTSDCCPEKVADMVISAINQSGQFVSCRGDNSPVTFSSAILRGIAPDRGLYVPEELPTKFSIGQLGRLATLTYTERASRVLERYPHGSLHPSELSGFCKAAYKSFPIENGSVLPVSHLQGQLYLMEMFHGPTASFKDLALQLTPHLLAHAARIEGAKSAEGLALLVATSGDTGIAALDGFNRVMSTPVTILFPAKGVSTIQRHQMLTCAPAKSLVLAVDADFDYCQTLAKDIFDDRKFYTDWVQPSDRILTSGNSMNWGRLLPQIVYALSGYLDLVNQGIIKIEDEIDVVVPTGNFGNILGVYLAKKLGVPIGKIICASNSNNILFDFIRTGIYDLRGRQLFKTHSPSVDILMSSNVERFIYWISNGDTELVSRCYLQLAKFSYFTLPKAIHDLIRSQFGMGWCNEQECIQSIRRIHQETRILVDPHTALAVNVASKRSPTRPTLIASTAHFGKFPAAVFEALGIKTDMTSIQSISHGLSSIDTSSGAHPLLWQSMQSSARPSILLPKDPIMIRDTIGRFLRDHRIESSPINANRRAEN